MTVSLNSYRDRFGFLYHHLVPLAFFLSFFYLSFSSSVCLSLGGKSKEQFESCLLLLFELCTKRKIVISVDVEPKQIQCNLPKMFFFDKMVVISSIQGTFICTNNLISANPLIWLFLVVRQIFELTMKRTIKQQCFWFNGRLSIFNVFEWSPVKIEEMITFSTKNSLSLPSSKIGSWTIDLFYQQTALHTSNN